MSPSSPDSAEEPKDIYTIDCVYCGQFAHRIFEEIIPTALAHFASMHDRRPIINVDYTAFKSPLRCDTCNDAIYATHFIHRSTPPTTVGLSVDSDGLWATCHTCHVYWQRRDIEGWVQHKMRVALQQTRLLNSQLLIQAVIRLDAIRRFRLLCERWDTGTLTTAPPIE